MVLVVMGVCHDSGCPCWPLQPITVAGCLKTVPLLVYASLGMHTVCRLGQGTPFSASAHFWLCCGWCLLPYRSTILPHIFAVLFHSSGCVFSRGAPRAGVTPHVHPVWRLLCNATLRYFTGRMGRADAQSCPTIFPACACVFQAWPAQHTHREMMYTPFLREWNSKMFYYDFTHMALRVDSIYTSGRARHCKCAKCGWVLCRCNQPGIYGIIVYGRVIRLFWGYSHRKASARVRR